MATPQTISAGIGLSTGTVILIAGIVAVGVVLYFNKNKNNSINIENLSSDETKYKRNTWIIENAIKNNDIEQLKELRNNKNIIKDNELAKLINDFLAKNDVKK